jgi:prepilin-type N-terminal cleavage/methylation domain-containing protein/prepilin-type processing-associated H-X9-DG protein
MRKAFTLIELLVVIAIIAILAAILFPVFAQAKASAKNTQDLSHIRQVGLANIMYATDNEDVFVPTGAPAEDYTWSPARDPQFDAAGNPWNSWGLKLQTYMKNREMLRSPFFPKTGAFTGDCAHANGMQLTNNYSINWLLGRDGTYGSAGDGDYGSSPTGVRLNSPVPLTAVNSPANTVAFLMSNSIPPRGSSWGCLFVTVEASDFINKIRQFTFHRDGGNIAFADGSARFVREPRMSPMFQGQNRRWTLYHMRSRGVWMQPTMPDDTMGYVNRDTTGTPAGDL